MKNKLFLGVDGCKNGWIAAVLEQGLLRLQRLQTIQAVVETYPDFDAFLIDVVVGLRDSINQVRPDDMARKALNPRGSTLFPIPCRAAVYADTEDEQKRINKKILGKSLSKQTINIIPKIREMDEFMSDHPAYKNRIHESHPELDFARLNGAVVLSKKKDAAGLSERMQILQNYLHGIEFPDFFVLAKEMNCNPDDLVDAVCLAVTAALYANGKCETIPEQPEMDKRGIYMKLILPGKDVPASMLNVENHCKT